MKSVGAAGAEIRRAAQKHGATVAVITSSVSGYGSVAVHFPAGEPMPIRHEQARALPCFQIHWTERYNDGRCTAHGVAVCS